MKMTRSKQINLARQAMKAVNGEIELTDLARVFLNRAKRFPVDSAWRSDLLKLSEFTADLAIAESIGGMASGQYSVFIKKGNRKLPFVAFSTLPGIVGLEDTGLCSGAGECREFCFSPKSWRYPAAFCRQVQNTLLMAFISGQKLIEWHFLRIKANSTVRLFVDGDWRTVEEVAFGMSLANKRPDLKLYGYSKSFDQLLAFDAMTPIFAKWPKNYALNLSSGHSHTAETVEKIKALPIYRGEFIALGKKGRLQYGTKAYGAEARKEAEKAGLGNVFVCPGLCGDCTTKTHACGDKTRFSEIPIVILGH